MKFVADSNIIFTFFWKNSVFAEVANMPVQLSSPTHALDELGKYKSGIMEKTGLAKKDFALRREKLLSDVSFMPLGKYSDSLKTAQALSHHLPESEQSEILRDIDFLALALKLNCPLWSNDKVLKKQPIPVLSTKEIVSLLDINQL